MNTQEQETINNINSYLNDAKYIDKALQNINNDFSLEEIQVIKDNFNCINSKMKKEVVINNINLIYKAKLNNDEYIYSHI